MRLLLVPLLAAPSAGVTERAQHFADLTDAARPHLKRGHEAATLRWLPLVARYFPPEDVPRALCVISYESGGDPDANRGRSRSAKGLWQHLDRYWDRRAEKAGVPGASIWDPEAQTIVAAWLAYHTRGGWSHWVVLPNCP